MGDIYTQLGFDKKNHNNSHKKGEKQERIDRTKQKMIQEWTQARNKRKKE